MPDNIVGDIAGANNELSKMKRLIGDIGVAAKKAFGGMAKDTKAMGNGGYGNRGYGVGQTNMMSQSFGSFSAFMPPTGNVGATWQWSNRMNMGMSAAQGGLRAATGAVVGGFMAMPDVAMTVGRASAFYGANLLQGATPGGRNAITNATFSAMKGGISGLGQDAATAGILSGLGVSTNSAQFGNLLTSTKNAARYLNIDNATAAQALGGLTSGATSQSLMRNFGMYTTDPITGRRLTPTEIFEQMNTRMTGGQKLTVEELKTSYQGGALASNLQNSGLDAAQQRLAYQYMLDKAAGKKMDLGNDALMSRLEKAAGINPDQASYDANTSQTATMNAATDSYIEGMKKATVYIDQFNKAMQRFLGSEPGKAMAQLTAGTDLAMKDPTIAGGVTGIGMALGGLGQIGGAVLGGAMLSRFLKGKGIIGGGGAAAGGAAAGLGKGVKLPKGYTVKNGVAYKPNPKSASGWSKVSAKELAGLPKGVSALSKGLGKAVPILGTAMAGFSIFDNISKGNWRGVAGDVGGLVGGFGLAAGVGTATGGVGFLGSAALYAGGSYAGSAAGTGLYDMFAGMGGGDGGPSLIGTGGNSASDAGTSTFKLIHPVGKAKIVCKYGVYDKLHPNGHWAVDWAATEGFGIMAAADGKVVEVGGESRNTMGTGNRSYGLRVKIDHGNGYSTLYAHLSGFDVSNGQTVKQGQQIGRVGNTGYSEAPHLHFELWKGGSRVDPSPFLGANYRENSGVAGGSSSARNGMAGSGDAGLLGFSSGAVGNGLKVPNAYSGAAIGKSSMGGGGRTSASSGGAGQFAGKGAGGMSTGLGGSIGTTGSGDGPGGGGGNNFVINLNIASASESEARRFAKLIQEYLDNDTLTSSMGRL